MVCSLYLNKYELEKAIKMIRIREYNRSYFMYGPERTLLDSLKNLEGDGTCSNAR